MPLLRHLLFTDSRHSRSQAEQRELWCRCLWAAGYVRLSAGPPSSISSECSASSGSWSGASWSMMDLSSIPGFLSRRNSSFRWAAGMLRCWGTEIFPVQPGRVAGREAEENSLDEAGRCQNIMKCPGISFIKTYFELRPPVSSPPRQCGPSQQFMSPRVSAPTSYWRNCQTTWRTFFTGTWRAKGFTLASPS